MCDGSHGGAKIKAGSIPRMQVHSSPAAIITDGTRNGREGPILYSSKITTVLKNEIKKFARESVLEVLASEMMHLRASLLATVSRKEQSAIERLYKEPSGKAVRPIK